MTTPIESALIIEVAEAESLVVSYRDQYDPSAAAGMPPHITLLYPFVAPSEIDDAVMAQLRDVCSHHSPFALQLTEIRKFPNVLYLAPIPDTLLKGLMADIFHAYSERPPYGGVFTEVIPHLTVAQVDDKGLLDQITHSFRQEAHHRLPIASHVSAVQLWDNASGGWQIRELFSLGQVK